MREPLYPHFHIYEIASRKSLFTQRRGETVLKVPEGSTTQLQGQPKQCFSAHFGLRIQATSTLRASLAPFSDSLYEYFIDGTSGNRPSPKFEKKVVINSSFEGCAHPHRGI